MISFLVLANFRDGLTGYEFQGADFGTEKNPGTVERSDIISRASAH
jgi:hypothetical protein